MPKFKITVFDTNTQKVVTEIVNNSMWPSVYEPYNMQCGAFGTPLKVERIMEADAVDSFDMTDEI